MRHRLNVYAAVFDRALAQGAAGFNNRRVAWLLISRYNKVKDLNDSRSIVKNTRRTNNV